MPARDTINLTHDYLVPSLREWLTRKQRESRRGRAELRLAVGRRSGTHKPENRNLPSLWEFVSIRLLTKSKTWTPAQRKMMRRAGRVHGIRSGIVAAVLVALLIGVRDQSSAVIQKQNATRAEGRGRTGQCRHRPSPGPRGQHCQAYRTWADPLLKPSMNSPGRGWPPAKLHWPWPCCRWTRAR